VGKEAMAILKKIYTRVTGEQRAKKTRKIREKFLLVTAFLQKSFFSFKKPKSL